MPSYEISLILKSFKKADMVQVLKRSTQFVLERGGIVRGVENAGTDMLPYQMQRGREKFQAGRYAFMQVDLGPTHIEPLRQHYRREEGIIRQNIVKLSEIPGVEKEVRFDRCKNLATDVKEEKVHARLLQREKDKYDVQ